MTDIFQVALPWVLAHEGGYVNHPKDPGGATNRGVTQRTYDAWRTRNGVSKQSVRQITAEEVEQIYRNQYWRKVAGDDMPKGLAYAVFDFAVNSGPARAAKHLQAILGVVQDGVIGEHTLAAVAGRNEEQLIVALCQSRMRFLRGLRTFSTFGRGWTRRVMGNQDGFQANDIGVIDRAVKLARDADAIPAPAIVSDNSGAKADARDTSAVQSIKDLARDPEALGGALSGAGAVLTAISASGPISWAVAALMVMGGVYVMVRLLRRERLA